MRRSIASVAGAVVMTLALGIGSAWAQGKVTVTREESKPKNVEIKAGQEVQFINASGGNAHVMFGDNGIMFYVGKGPSRVKFDKAGTFDYTVHVTGTKVHAHTGSVVVR